MAGVSPPCKTKRRNPMFLWLDASVTSNINLAGPRSGIKGVSIYAISPLNGHPRGLPQLWAIFTLGFDRVMLR
jgi:hypothetical protein